MPLMAWAHCHPARSGVVGASPRMGGGVDTLRRDGNPHFRPHGGPVARPASQGAPTPGARPGDLRAHPGCHRAPAGRSGHRAPFHQPGGCRCWHFAARAVPVFPQQVRPAARAGSAPDAGAKRVGGAVGHTGHAASADGCAGPEHLHAVRADPGSDPRAARRHLGDPSPARRADAYAGACRIACLCHRAHRTRLLAGLPQCACAARRRAGAPGGGTGLCRHGNAV